MVADGLGDLAAPLADRELRRICDGGHGGYWGWSRMRRSRRVRWAASCLGHVAQDPNGRAEVAGQPLVEAPAAGRRVDQDPPRSRRSGRR